MKGINNTRTNIWKEDSNGTAKHGKSDAPQKRSLNTIFLPVCEDDVWRLLIITAEVALDHASSICSDTFYSHKCSARDGPPVCVRGLGEGQSQM